MDKALEPARRLGYSVLHYTGKVPTMSSASMTPKQAADALVAALPRAMTNTQLLDYGLEVSEDQGRGINREVLSLNLFWIFAAIDAHIPKKYQPAVAELVLEGVQMGWPMVLPPGERAWTAFLNDWQDRRKRYNQLVEEGVSPLAINAESAVFIEEEGLVKEEDRRNMLTLLIDYVPVDTYGKLLEDIG